MRGNGGAGHSQDRLAVLAGHISDEAGLFSAAFFEYGGFEAQRDDILDATVNVVCSLHVDRRVALGCASELDEEGLPMEMVYWRPRRTAE